MVAAPKKPTLRAREPKQIELVVVTKATRGGKRKGAGRPPANPDLKRKNASHRRRPEHAARCPVHVTMRVAKGLPPLRCELIQKLLKEVLKAQSRRDYGTGFQVVHFSIQDNHLHVAAEAKGAAAEEIARSPRLLSQRARRGLETKDRDMIRRGIAGLAISFARRLNKLLRRRGKVWAERHHRRDLTTPTDVRNTLFYIFQNFRRHGTRVHGIGATDRFSTAPSFDGWLDALDTPESLGDTEPWRPPTRTWLLGRGWLRGGGLLSTGEAPPLSPHVRFSPEALAYETAIARRRATLGIPS